MRIATIVVLGVFAALAGTCGAFNWYYYREARELRSLAEAIDGVEVLGIDGNHDTTLEDLWRGFVLA